MSPSERNLKRRALVHQIFQHGCRTSDFGQGLADVEEFVSNFTLQCVIEGLRAQGVENPEELILDLFAEGELVVDPSRIKPDVDDQRRLAVTRRERLSHVKYHGVRK